MSLLLNILPVVQAEYDLSNSANTDASKWAWLFGGIGILLLIVIIVVFITFYTLWFINIYNWGTTDSSSFPNGLSGKKKWFWLFFLVPLIAVIVFGWIPLINIVFIFGLGIYMLVIVLYYFFAVRPKTKS